MLRDKIRAAAWLISSIQQRQNTILRVMESILKFQHDFFEHGVSHLKPLVLRAVAEDIDMSEGTVSRTTSNKYVHTPGVYSASKMRDESRQDNYNPNDAKKCVPLKRCTADYTCQADKPRLRVFIADSQDGVGGVVAAIMLEEFQQTYDLRVFFTRCATELMKADDERRFDLFILNVDVIYFSSRLNFISALEFRKKIHGNRQPDQQKQQQPGNRPVRLGRPCF